jgi:hypothetical protein
MNPRGTKPATFSKMSLRYLQSALNSFTGDVNMPLCGTEKLFGILSSGPELISLRISGPPPP